jgi:ABC-type transport system involved in multi-copper enzyme maturation permease subunit
MSSRFVDRARFRVDLWREAPNPLWIRELRQSARLTRTPLLLAVLTIGMTLLIAGVGGLVSTWESPATTGVVIFQVFFSIAYFLVTLIGPAVAANSIASEREGRTWEAVLLTGLAPGVIARGKFLSAFTSIAMYLVMMAPVAALPFLFGGVTATEVVVAFAGLFLIALLSIAFGLAMSSLMSSMRAAIVVTLLLAVPLSTAAFIVFGFFLSYGVHRVWPGVAEGPPIWLPTAYERAPFDASYVIFLVVLPVLSIALPAWFLYEVTIANLTSVTDDRSSGLKRWFLVAAPALTIAATVPVLTVSSLDREGATLAGLVGLFLFLGFCVFLFAGDPIGPSRRVIVHWDRMSAGRLRRFLGPGVMRSASLLLFAGAGLVVVAAVGLERCAAASGVSSNEVTGVACFAGYAICFYVFVVGLGAFLRSRAQSSMSARVLMFAILFGVSVGPWIITAIFGLVADRFDREALLVAAPSPFFVVVMLESIGRSTGAPALIIGAAAAGFWALVGLLLLASAGKKCRDIIQKHEAVLAETDRILAAEDEAARAAHAQPEVPADAPPPAEEAAPETMPAGG